MSYPLIGNYGVPDVEDRDDHGIPKFVESELVHVSALIVADYCDEYSHWNAKSSLGDWSVY